MEESNSESDFNDNSDLEDDNSSISTNTNYDLEDFMLKNLKILEKIDQRLKVMDKKLKWIDQNEKFSNNLMKSKADKIIMIAVFVLLLVFYFYSTKY